MVRKLNGALDEHYPWSFASAATSMIELMFKLAGIQVPPQVFDLKGNWTSLLDQTFSGIILRRLTAPVADAPGLLTTELNAGRPVGLLLRERDPHSGQETELGWVAMRANQIRPYLFIDAVRKHPEAADGQGRFTERRVIQFDSIPPASLSDLVYCEELVPRTPHKQRGRPRKPRI
jgi:hypothetical protein